MHDTDDTQAPANAPRASNAQQTASWEAALEPFVGSVDWAQVWRDCLTKLLTAPDTPSKDKEWYDDSRSPGYGKAFGEG